MTFGVRKRSFDVFKDTDLGGGLFFQPIYSEHGLLLEVRAVLEPGTCMLMVLAMLTATRPRVARSR